MKVKRKITKALAALLMLCMILPQTAVAAAYYYIELSISGPGIDGDNTTVRVESGRLGSLNDNLPAAVVGLIKAHEWTIREKYAGQGLGEIFSAGVSAYDGTSTEKTWEQYVQDHFASVDGDDAFKTILSDKSSAFSALTVNAVNQIRYEHAVYDPALDAHDPGNVGTWTVTVTLRSCSVGSDPDDSGSSGSGSGSASGSAAETTIGRDGVSESRTETITNKDGSGFAVTETTVTRPDGTITASKTETTINKDGSTVSITTSTITNPDGTTAESRTEAATSTVTNEDGSTTETRKETTTTNTGGKTESITVTTTDQDGVITSVTASATTEKDGTTTASKTETTARPDGSGKEVTTSTVAKPSGTVVERTTETTARADGSSQSITTSVTTRADGTVVESTTNAATTVTRNNSTGTVTATTISMTTTSDGVKSESRTVTEIKKDGTVTSRKTVNASTANGTTASMVTTTDARKGTVTRAAANVSGKDASEAAENHTAVTIPVEIPATRDQENAPIVSVKLPGGSGSVKVEIPVAKPDPGLVAIVVDEKGNETLVPKSVVTESGLKMKMGNSTDVKIVDNGKSFQDVPADHWANDAAAFASARNLFQGVNETTFAPNRPMTRGMLATVLYRLESEPDIPVGAAFPDVKEGAYYADGVSWASDNGIVTGYGDGTYKPDQVITRQQLAAMLYRCAGAPETGDNGLDVPDASSVSDYAKDAMKWAVGNGIMRGKTNGTLDPHGLATRAQVAVMVMRYSGHALEQ